MSDAGARGFLTGYGASVVVGAVGEEKVGTYIRSAYNYRYYMVRYYIDAYRTIYRDRVLF